MPLSSQAGRAGLSRHYMSSESTRRRRRKWPWFIVLAVGVAAVVVAIQWLAGIGLWRAPDDASATAVAKAPAPKLLADAQASEADGQASPAKASAAAPAVPTLTFSRQGVNGVGGASVSPASQQATAESIPASQPAVSDGDASSPAASMTILAPVFTAGPAPATSSVDVATKLKQGRAMIEAGRVVEGRRLLSDLLFNQTRNLAPADAQSIRDALTKVNQTLIFSPTIVPGDPLAAAYHVKSGDTLTEIAAPYKVPHQFLERINGVNPRRIQVGQRIKVIKGPFDVRVSKSDFRMDLLLHNPEGQPIYVCSFSVGLGRNDATPVGKWLVAPGKKVVNPGWTNPRNNEHYGPNNPRNPVGEYWIALEGIGQHTKDLSSYGIHGTIDPDSIGKERSMGCIRMGDKDIKEVFAMLQDGASTVWIMP